MATYIALLKWTPQGLQDVKHSPSRLDAARKSLEAAGRCSWVESRYGKAPIPWKSP